MSNDDILDLMNPLLVTELELYGTKKSERLLISYTFDFLIKCYEMNKLNIDTIKKIIVLYELCEPYFTKRLNITDLQDANNIINELKRKIQLNGLKQN